MTRHPPTRVLAAAVVVAAASVTVAAVLAAGTASTRSTLTPSPPAVAPPSMQPPSTQPPAAADPEVDLGEPAAVCDAFAAALFTLDTAADTGPGAAYRRAAAYATTQLAAHLGAASARRAAHWQQLATHTGKTSVEVGSYAGETPPDRGRVTHRAAVVMVGATGRDGWRGTPRRYIVYCTLHQTGPWWKIAAYELEAARLP
jgi:hypothetical protein